MYLVLINMWGIKREGKKQVKKVEMVNGQKVYYAKRTNLMILSQIEYMDEDNVI